MKVSKAFQCLAHVLRRVCVLALCAAPQFAAAGEVTVFAAASLKTALEDIAAAFEDATDHKVTLSFAGSSVLARQIQAGAPADVFFSANPDWMDYLEDQGLIASETRADVISNKLVLIAPAGAAMKTGGVRDVLAQGQIAVALVDAVPAGMYARAVLQHLGLWPGVTSRLVQADNVRAALAYVALGEVEAGIVYQSDAMAEKRVDVVAVFPDEAHPPIVYPAAVVAGRESVGAMELVAFLKSPMSQAAFLRRGFTALAR